MEPVGITAKRSFTVRPHLPPALSALRELAHNLRWSYDRDTQSLFARVDPQGWASGVRDPARLLAEADKNHLEQLATDNDYLAALEAAAETLRATLTRPEPISTPQGTDSDSRDGFDHLVAYFSPEFGVTEAFNQYSGGLGVLAGDHLKSAGDLAVPLVAVGLFYRHGYFHQELTVDGWQTERFDDVDPHSLPLTAMDPTVEVDLAGRPLLLRIWRAQLGPTHIYLLDADLPENPEDLRLVTDRLYGGDVEHRLRQEIVLGVGGVRALDALGEPVAVFHTNEGHAGFMGLERIRMLMERDGLGFDEAFDAVRAGSVFTTHTPVPAGIDQFPRPLIERYFADWTRACGVGIDDLMALGHVPGEPTDRPFNMASMGMRLSQFRNGVSRMHGETSRAMFASLWPGIPTEEVPIGHVTNGVHPQTWLSPAMAELLESALGPPAGWHRSGWDAVKQIPDEDLARVSESDRTRLVEVVRRRLAQGGLAAGRSPSELAWTDLALDPGYLTICFARRMAAHKRAALLLEQPDRLRALLAERPVQFIFAGKAHPGDESGKEMIRRLVAFAGEPDMRGRFVFVEDYDMALARAMVQGSDVWLNTPLHPLEASGTSGMKAALNGGLNLSVLDGWWAEGFDNGSGPDVVPNGWAIAASEANNGESDPARRSRLDCDALYELIENQVLPLWSETAAPGGGRPWFERVRRSLVTLGPFVDAHRMVRQYTDDIYVPAAATSSALGADGYAGAKKLAAFRQRAVTNWDMVRIASVEADEVTGDLGSTRTVTASVVLGEFAPDDVEVQLLIGHLGPGGALIDPEVTTMSVDSDRGNADGCVTYEGLVTLSVPGRMGLTVRILPSDPLLQVPLDLGLVTWAG